ncbi:hypothetical protein BH11BAC6_BH11BAC6_00520 [soil metagenome]
MKVNKVMDNNYDTGFSFHGIFVASQSVYLKNKYETAACEFNHAVRFDVAISTVVQECDATKVQ